VVSGLNFSWAGSVGPTRLGSARRSAWPAAQQSGSGSGLAGRAGRLGLKSFAGRHSFSHGLGLLISRIGPAPFSSSLAGLPLRLLLLADRTAPCISLGGIQCGRAWIRGAVGGRACVRVVHPGRANRCMRGVQGKSPKDRPRREHDVAAAVRGHCARQGRGGVVAWRRRLRRGVRGKARLGPRQRAVAWLGFAVRVRVHARGFWSSRATVWPCRARGTGIPGPRHDAAVRGDSVCRGTVAARRVPAQEAAQRPEGKGVLWPGYGGFIGIAGSSGRKRDGGSDAHRRG
jgi:hypothetical protein